MSAGFPGRNLLSAWWAFILPENQRKGIVPWEFQRQPIETWEGER